MIKRESTSFRRRIRRKCFMLAEVVSVRETASEALRTESNSTIVGGIPAQISVLTGLKKIAMNAKVETAHEGIIALSAVT